MWLKHRSAASSELQHSSLGEHRGTVGQLVWIRLQENFLLQAEPSFLVYNKCLSWDKKYWLPWHIYPSCWWCTSKFSAWILLPSVLKKKTVRKTLTTCPENHIGWHKGKSKFSPASHSSGVICMGLAWAWQCLCTSLNASALPRGLSSCYSVDWLCFTSVCHGQKYIKHAG